MQLLFAVLTLLVVAALAPRAAAVEARSVKLTAAEATTLFSLDLSQGVKAEAYTLADPYRVVIDLPGVNFRLPRGAGTTSSGLVRAFRYGVFAPGRGRIVIDTTGPVLIYGADMEPRGAAGEVTFNLTLMKASKEVFGLGTGVVETRPPKPPPAPPPLPQRQAITAPLRQELPVVVIDPGHGGLDPGAVVGSTYEKDIALAVGRAVMRQLRQSAQVKVLATRTADTFVTLDQRIAISQNATADLFVSLHADSLADRRAAQNIRGATVYTLSDRASDALARRMADKENRADTVAGLPVAIGQHDQTVTNILIDLMKRETANHSIAFSKVLASQLTVASPARRTRRRAAAFKVLKQARTPSVLVELGYLSNNKDRSMMLTKRWQDKAARSISTAILDFFARRAARSQ
ncbi:MAG: N-acetylmuramoyl-L-alanine amidase [Pseudomonadota bacterium]